MLSALGYHLIRKRPAVWLTLGCSLGLAAVLAVLSLHQFRLNLGADKRWATHLSDRSAGVLATDKVEKESTTLDQSVETNTPRLGYNALATAGVTAEKLAHSTASFRQ